MKDEKADWCAAKGANEFAAVSDFVPKSTVYDHDDIEIELTINGETRQKSNSSFMIFDIPTMIADISKYQTLNKGDLIFTGTPEGVGPVRDGDSVHIAMRNGRDMSEIVSLTTLIERQ